MSVVASTRDVEDVFRVLGGPVHGYLRASGAIDSEDLLSDVFVDVMRGLRRFEGDDDALRRWVFTIAHNRLVDARRRTERRRRAAPAERVRPMAPPDEPFDAELEAALDRLTPDQRDVVILRFVADLPLETVASMTGKGLGAVKALQHRALARLESELRPRPISSSRNGSPQVAPAS